MTPAEQLRAAKALIDAPEKWTTGDPARDRDGKLASCVSEEAVCWCAIGALWAQDKDGLGTDKAEAFLDEATDGCVAMFNDEYGRTHGDIMAAYDRAIALAEAGQ